MAMPLFDVTEDQLQSICAAIALRGEPVRRVRMRLELAALAEMEADHRWNEANGIAPDPELDAPVMDPAYVWRAVRNLEKRNANRRRHGIARD